MSTPAHRDGFQDAFGVRAGSGPSPFSSTNAPKGRCSGERSPEERRWGEHYPTTSEKGGPGSGALERQDKGTRHIN
ncbi:hypothetical protein JMJ78_0003839 [Colletotrichum scovillei]|nr:hypothetical protein JMJ78_0003839 [Colletotrichum scovillei]